MPKKFKKLAAAPLALALSLSGAGAAFADEAPVVPTQPPVVDPETPGEDDGPIITPFALLIDQQVSFRGEGQATWVYRSEADMRFYLRNDSSKAIHYRLLSPYGYYPLINGTIQAGKAVTSTFPLYDVHGEISWGRYTLYVYNDDGSAGSFYVSARSLE